MEKDPKPFTHEQDTQDTHIHADDEIVVPVHEEELTATTRSVQRGSVRVEKDVIEERQSIDVPVTEDEVDVTRRRVDREVTEGSHAFEDESISVPLKGEEVQVEKRTRVAEEIEIETTSHQHTERVTGTVRREDVFVEGEGDIERRDDRGDRRRE